MRAKNFTTPPGAQLRTALAISHVPDRDSEFLPRLAGPTIRQANSRSRMISLEITIRRA
jgi:hypothetical protein